jgi:tetratricopeptide (TPR) repeat protein
MKHRQITSLVASACLLLSLAASSLLLRRTDQLRPQAALDEVLFLSSPKVIERASLGYNGLMACIYWTRAVQYFGSRHASNATSYNLLAPLLEITTHLDPRLMVAYEFGSSFLAPKPPHGAGQPERAIELMEYGIRNNPDNWRLYYDLGFVYYTELRDYKHAAETFERGSHVPDTHPFLKVLAAQMAQHAGDYETARMLWSATYQTTQDQRVRDNAVEHLRALRVDQDVQRLQEAVTRFGQRSGRLPVSMLELVAAEGLAATPTDPDGHPYQLTREGRVEVQVPDDFSFATRGLPPGYTPQPKFHSPRP